MEFTCDYLEVEMELSAFAESVSERPFATRADQEALQDIIDKRRLILKRGIIPFIEKADSSFLDSNDKGFLYSSRDYREQVFFQYFLQKFYEDVQRERASRGIDSPKMDPAGFRMSAHAIANRRNDGLVGIAAQPVLMRLLSKSSPILASNLAGFAERTKTFPSAMKHDRHGFYDMRLAAYRDLGIAVPENIERFARAMAYKKEQARDYSVKAAQVLFSTLEKGLVWKPHFGRSDGASLD